ncbi:MAG: sulfatase [Candidatus Aminicenantes bacterium]|nr:sulfatase [Candidatus Aminicenantes bacterium]
MKIKILNYKLLFLLALLLLLYPIIQCRLSHDGSSVLKKNGLVRLIDNLDANSVRTTPFQDLLHHFDSIQENLKGKTTEFRELSTSKQRVFAATTSRSILGYSDTEKPQKMDILMNDTPLEFLNGGEEGSIRWKWIKTNHDIDFSFDKNYNKRLQYLFLEEEEYFEFETIFPDAPVEIQILTRRNWHPIDLQVFLDGEFISGNHIGRNSKLLKVPVNSTCGTHKIKIQAGISERLKAGTRPSPPRLLINLIRVVTKNDVILFFVPASLQKDFFGSDLTAEYLTDLSESGKENPFYKLYKTKYTSTLDEYDQKNNPENIKKKINLENLSLDVLMAPPETELEFHFSLPQNCYLEFGIGIYTENVHEGPFATRFKILLEEGKNKNTLYDKEFVLQPESLKEQMIHEKIDLNPYADKNIKLTFITEKSEQSSPENNNFAFWANPILYTPKPDKRNIILISLDTLRADHLSCYGYHRNTSPNLDEFAKDCVLFENVFAHSSWTLPSHLSMLFSLNGASHQVYYNTQKIDNSIPSLASYLRDNGYVTYGFTGGGYVSSIYGFAKGFDWYDEPIGGRNAPLADDEAERLYEYTSDWINKNKDKQFFLFLHTFQIHGPYQCPEPWIETYLDENAKWKGIGLRLLLEEKGQDFPFTPEERENIKALYDGEIKYTDETLIKPLIEFLKKNGLYDNTLLIITSDHGEEFYEHGGWLHSRTLYNELIRVPLFIKFPSSKHKGIQIKPKARLIDIMPTILEACSIDFPYDSLEGRSLIDLITGNEKEDRTFISDLAYKDIYDPCPALIATNEGNIKVIIEKSKTGIKNIETYDIENDPGEQSQNVFNKAVKVRNSLLDFIDKYYQEKLKIERKKSQIQLDEKMKEKLRALGYLR